MPPTPVTKQRTSDRNPGQDDPDATGVLDLHPGPDMGCQPRIRPSGHRKMRPPETVHFPFPGITLIDEEVRENARIRLICVQCGAICVGSRRVQNGRVGAFSHRHSGE
jgi:hypothetical protein